MLQATNEKVNEVYVLSDFHLVTMRLCERKFLFKRRIRFYFSQTAKIMILSEDFQKG